MTVFCYHGGNRQALLCDRQQHTLKHRVWFTGPRILEMHVTNEHMPVALQALADEILQTYLQDEKVHSALVYAHSNQHTVPCLFHVFRKTSLVLSLTLHRHRWRTWFGTFNSDCFIACIINQSNVRMCINNSMYMRANNSHNPVLMACQTVALASLGLSSSMHVRSASVIRGGCRRRVS